MNTKIVLEPYPKCRVQKIRLSAYQEGNGSVDSFTYKGY